MTRRSKKEQNVLSFSKVSEFLRCPYLYYQEYVVGKEIKPSRAMEYGAHVHKAAEKLAYAKSPEDVKKIVKEFDCDYSVPENKAMAYAEFFADKKILGVELEGVKELKDSSLMFEYHVDSLSVDQYGNIYVIDLKTTKVVPSKDEIADDLQLNLYAWIVWNSIYEKIKSEFSGKFYIGYYLWQYMFPVYVEININELDYTDKLINIGKRMLEKNDNNFPRVCNRFCCSCPMLMECIPDQVPDTYNGIKNRIKALEEQLEIKKTHLLQKFLDFDCVKIESEADKGYYILKERKNSVVKKDLLYKNIKGNEALMLEFLKPTKSKLKELGIKFEEETTGISNVISFKETL